MQKMSNEGNKDEKDQFFATLLTHDRLKMGLCYVPAPAASLKKIALQSAKQTKFTVLHCCHLSQFFCNPALHHQQSKAQKCALSDKSQYQELA